MELKNGPVSIFSLIGNSLKVANSAFGSVIGLIILIILLALLPMGLALMLSKLINGPLGMAAISLPLPLIISYLQLVFFVAVIKLLASRFENSGLTVTGSIGQSFLPAVYLVISFIIIGIPLGALMFVIYSTKSMALIAGSTLILCFALLPLGFVYQTIALRDEGPISAIQYAFSLGYRYYLRLFTAMVLLFLFGIFSLLLVVCLIKAFVPPTLLLLPSLAFAQLAMASAAPAETLQILSGTLGSSAFILSIIGLLMMAIYLYIYLFSFSVWTGLFLNLDYMDRGTQNREMDQLTMIPVPSGQEAIIKAHQHAAPGVALHLPSQPPVQTQQEEVPFVNLTQSSVKTQADNSLNQHLDEVYRAQDHLSQAVMQEEDRMPTILFDEEMSKQLAEAEEKLKQQQQLRAAQKKKNTDNGPDSIKMSDKPL